MKKLVDNSQFQLLSHSPSFDLDNLCDNIKNNVDLLGFKHVEFDKNEKLDMNKVEEFVYEMKTTFKTIPIDIFNSLPKILYDKLE